jgi:hypothetical protein
VSVYVGEVLTLRGSVNATWRSSMEVAVRVEAENPTTGETRHISSAYLTIVASDEQSRPAEVPPLAAESPTEQRREREAQLRRANRLVEPSRSSPSGLNCLASLGAVASIACRVSRGLPERSQRLVERLAGVLAAVGPAIDDHPVGR